jgi:hypothetical protein
VDKEYTAGEAKAWLNGYDEGKKIRMSERSIQTSDSQAAESARSWVGLTKEELAEISEFHFHGALSGREFYDDIEAKLKEKNT